MSNPLGYPDEVWRRFRDTPRAGRLAAGVAAEVGTPAAQLRLRLEVRAQAGRIEDAVFQAWGCPYTIATGSWLADWLVGRRTDQLLVPALDELRSALEIPEDRAHCWIMAQDILRDLHRHLSSGT